MEKAEALEVVEDRLRKVYVDSKRYSPSIMQEVMQILSKKKIKFHANSSDTEINVVTNKSKSEIEAIVYERLEKKMPRDIIDSLLNFVSVNKDIYIRLSRR